MLKGIPSCKLARFRKTKNRFVSSQKLTTLVPKPFFCSICNFVFVLFFCFLNIKYSTEIPGQTNSFGTKTGFLCKLELQYWYILKKYVKKSLLRNSPSLLQMQGWRGYG